MNLRNTILALACVLAGAITSWAADPTAWPAITRQCRPWAYHWWMGSAVDRENLARELRRYREGGLGGIHIIPIYGVKGAEDRAIRYLSPQWMEMMAFAVREGAKNDLGVDMTTGTGWCFGGPQISPENSCMRVNTLVVDPPKNASPWKLKLGRQEVLAAVAQSPDGKCTDVHAQIDRDGRVNWRPTEPGSKLIVLLGANQQCRVKRASPGGEGFMLNPLYAPAMEACLKPFSAAFDTLETGKPRASAAFDALEAGKPRASAAFDTLETGKPRVSAAFDASAAGKPRASAAFDTLETGKPRAMYHDSFEYQVNWSPDLFAAFAKWRGYRLEDQLPALAGVGNEDVVRRVRGDYQETVSDLMIENTFPQWFKWCRDRGFITRNQAHGAPGNILDLYAMADIPETEMFGHGGTNPLVSSFDENFGKADRKVLISKFASSAAHVAGRQLTASETCTWLAEHFCETLEEIKCMMDRVFVSGVNHTFYHGCVYSPDDAAWPGWLFYASTQMNPRNSIWHDAPAINAYVARCQSVLQSGHPDNDVLLYWPIHDLWHTPGKPGAGPTVVPCMVHGGTWLVEQPVGATAQLLWQRGFGFDYVSDRQLESAQATGTGIQVPGGTYRAIVVPPTSYIPLSTLRKLVALSQQGAVVIFQDRLPQDVPGLANLEQRQAERKQLLAQGNALRVGDVEKLLTQAGIAREAVTDTPDVMFIRRCHEEGRHYFIANQGMNLVDGWVALGTPARSVVIMDPLTGKTGMGNLRRGKGGTEIRLRLDPGHSIILRTFTDREVAGQAWPWNPPGDRTHELTGPWQVTFVSGGPELPKAYQTARLDSWTANGDPQTERFAGTAVYRTTFDAPAGNGPWTLDLGRVCHSARVRLNGRELGTLMMKPYRLPLDGLRPAGNVLEVEVTNLSANRIRDLDRRKVVWRIFQEINLVNIGYRPFDASNWPVFDSGLLGPVRLVAGERGL